MKNERLEKYKQLKEIDSKSASKEIKQSRGSEFEVLINNLFEDEEILLRRSYHTIDGRSEQIDGAVEIFGRIFLIEVKWVESGLAASELYAFIGKTENKFSGTMGIFISHEKLSDNFLNSLNKGRRQSIIVIHGEDIEYLFTHKVKLKDYITAAYKLLSYDNLVHFPIKRFLENKPKNLEIVEQSETSKQAALKFIKEALIIKERTSNEVLLEMENQTTAERDATFLLLLKNYSNIWYNSLTKNFGIINNIDNYIKLHELSEGKKIEAAEDFYKTLVTKAIEIYSREKFSSFIYPYYKDVSSQIKQTFEDFLLEEWAKNYDWFDRENQLTDLIRPIWDFLSQETKSKLSEYYLDIYLSDRSEKFSQKRFSNYLLNESKIDLSTIEYWLDKKLIESKNSYEELSIENINFIAFTFAKMAKHLGIDLPMWKEFIKEKIKNIS